MKARLSILSRLGWIIAALAVLLIPVGAAFAQDYGQSAGASAAVGIILVVELIFFVAIYVYMALALVTIAKKTNTPNAVWGWIPILNLILMLNIAKKPIWWIILCLIPFVNIIIFIIIWMAIAEARQKPSWWGIMLIIPVMNLIMPGYLAWAD